MCLRTVRPSSGKVPIKFGTYNIRNWRNGGLEAALRGMSQANMVLSILQETKLTNGIYTHGSSGYSAVATDASSRHRGGVAIFYRSEPHLAVEAVEKFGPNVISFQLATGARRWYIVGVYLAPDDTETMKRVIEAMRRRPRGAELLVAGDFNVSSLRSCLCYHPRSLLFNPRAVHLGMSLVVPYKPRASSDVFEGYCGC